MRASHRRAAVRRLTVLGIALVALAGCGGDGEGRADGPATTTSAAPSATPSSGAPSPSTDDATAPSTATGGADDPSGTAPWAGTKQFVQIERARTAGGRTYLSVRPAEKEAHDQFEAWVITPGEGPYTEVPMAEDATVLLSVPLGDGKHPASYSQAEFVSRLTARPDPERELLGYDLSFDGEGRVTRLQSLYQS
ncbi:hypothetical protein [Streptomyces sp. NPDC048002]|uniref:hypothetical protein n=1 Tax=unclassified Streptomyces TaxID=2593676 RepID=UPI0033DEDB50